VDTDIVATVPARPEYIRVFRAVARAVAARADFTTDRIEDLHLAVDEACAEVLSVRVEAGTLTLRISTGQESLIVLVCSDAEVDAPGWPPEEVERSLSWRVLSALTDQATFELDEIGPSVRMTFKGLA
jgi:serine/threonine-protein kinase RsbW